MSIDLHLITRCNYRKNKGYLVRVNRNKVGVGRIRKRCFFGRGSYGSWGKALDAAISWRDSLLAIHGLPLHAEGATYLTATKRSSTGKLGVHLYEVVDRRRRREYRQRVVCATLRGGKHRIFPVKKYGVRKAVRLAEQARRAA